MASIFSPFLRGAPHDSASRNTPACDADQDGATCSIWYVRAKLGRQDYGDRRLIAYLSLLIADHGFPPPLPVYTRRGTGKGQPGQLTSAVCTASRWQRRAVDQWLDDFLPPDNAASLDRAAMAAAANEMDAAAFNLGNLKVINGGRA